ncbi:MAG: DNA polymerase III subunit gamma/tau [Bacteroidales bacterium]|nr:DNA polymerase III subunit gamma/tau [Bacteroidales bacterium]
MAFIVSARKYRPQSFETLIGQDNISRTLRNSILTGQMAHAYLFCGPRGVGKTTTARIFAKTINCSNPGPNMEPCGECESCKSFEEGRSYCIHELDAASNNSVDDIRNLIDQVRIPPQIGKYSVFIIDEVHMLSASAFNAFLKTLEEPPAHAIFILATTEKHKILPTILSRCQTYDFNRITIEDMVKNLKDIAAKESVTISEDALHIIAQKADGSMRDALTLFDQTVAFCGDKVTYEMVIKNLNVLDYEYYFRLTEFFLRGEYAQALILFDEILSKGFNSLHFVSGLSQHFRDLIVCKNKASRTLATLAPSIIARYDEFAAKCPLKFLYEALSVTTTCEAGYKSSGNPRLLIEFSLMKICKINGELSEEVSAPEVASKPVEAKVETPVEAPAKASAEAPEEPKPAPKMVDTGFSIKDLMKEIKDGDNTPAAASVQADDQAQEAVTAEKLNEAWKSVLETIKQPRLLAELSRSFPVFNEEDMTATQYVANTNQKDWIMSNCFFALESTLRKSLKNKDIKLNIEVRPDTEPKERKPFTSSEIAQAMRDKSKDMKTLEQTFELELM